MVGISRIRRQQIIREAEGYLDLALLFGESAVPAATRQRLAERSLAVLARLGDSGGYGHAHYLRGQALRTMDRFEEAIEPLKLAADAEPSDIHVWLALGWCYKRTGRLDMAIESLEEALAVDSAKAIIHYNLACYWSLAHNKRQSLEYLAQALKLDPQYRDLIDSESDFDSIRDDPLFQALASVIV